MMIRDLAHRVSDAACDAHVVLLGELPSHGEARGFAVKAAVVEELVERCGFRALIFEAPFYEFVGFNAAVAAGAATPRQLDRAIGRFWWTRELAPWRGWLFQQARSRRLTLGGMDDQVSITSDFARATLPPLVGRLVGGSRAARCEESVRRHLFWQYTDSLPFDATEQRWLLTCVQDAQAGWGEQAERDQQIADAEMLGAFAGYAARQQEGSTAPGRDLGMYRAVMGHLQRLPAGTKVVVWTATVHAARAMTGGEEAPLGMLLATRLGHRLVSVGFTALGGESSMAGRPVRTLPTLPPGSLEARALAGGAGAVVLDSVALAALGALPSRLLGRTGAGDWASLFDLVVVIGREVAPAFDPWE
ncbi:MAG: erythromycin esterase family protein [Gemmatimonadetes bacterium]|nr:erythromycin esterase family protein [Gemmatimonadota bacterium]